MRSWSPSQARMYRDCPRQWWFRHVNGATPTSRMASHLLVGTAAHAGLEQAYRSAATFPGYLPGLMSRYQGEALDAVTAKWEALGIQTADEAALPAVLDRVASTLDALPVPHPKAILGVELDMKAPAPWGTPLAVSADLVLRTGRDSVHVRDWKYRNVSSLPAAEDLLDDDQLGVYRALVAQRWPWVHTVTAGLYSIISAREVLVEFPESAAIEALARVESTAERAESDRVWTPTPSPSVCGSCRFVSLCPVWTNKAP
jgi:CRISPR/Cas system-associated exonuclease Cas4 (RecB family)